MSYWIAFVAWIHTVPDVIWSAAIGAVLASGISYFGVRSANASSLERLHVQHEHDAAQAEKQREHDARQKEEDRKAAIRREVYTEAAEKVHACIGALGSLPERPLGKPLEDIEPLQAFLRASSKVWLVAEAPGAHLSRELVSLMSELFLDVSMKAFPLRIAMEPAREIDRKLVLAEGDVQRISAHLLELKSSGAAQDAQEIAGRTCKEADDYVSALKAEKRRIVSGLRDKRLAHAKEMFAMMEPMQVMLVKLVSALRAELGLPPDEAEFLAQLDDAQKRSMATLLRAYGATT